MSGVTCLLICLSTFLYVVVIFVVIGLAVLRVYYLRISEKVSLLQFGAKSNIQQIIPFHFLRSNILLKSIKFLSQMPLLIPCHQSNYILPNKIILPTWLPTFPTQYQWNQTINSYIPQVDRSFNLDFGGSIQVKLHLGLVKPPRNRKLPFYNQYNLQLLQEETNTLEALGVIANLLELMWSMCQQAF